MRTNEVIRLFNEIVLLQGVKKTVWEFNRMCIAVKKAIKSIVEDYSEEQTALSEEIVALKVEHCQKDENGKAIIARKYNRDDNGRLTLTEEQYIGLVRGENPEFDKRFKQLNEEMKNIGDKEVEPDFSAVIPVKRKHLPKDQWDGNREEIFWDFIEENKTEKIESEE